MARRMSAGDICKEALGLQGLPVPVAVVTNTTDPSSKQMWTLLRTVGRRMCKPQRTHRWQVLTREWVLPTVPGKTLYDLPADHDGFLDSTAWNYTSRLPMLGPANDTQWQCLKARSLGASTISIVYRTAGGKFQLYNSPSDSQELHIAYTSRNWVLPAKQSDPSNPTYADAPVEDGDLVLFDPEMMVAALQHAFMTAKGFDTASMSVTLDGLIEAAINMDSDAPVLSVVASDGFPLISPQMNLPDTGYGV